MSRGVFCAALVLATLAPSLLALNVPPSATLLNQAAAWVGWGAVATYALSQAVVPLSAALRLARVLVAALGLVILGAAASAATSGLPSGLALASVGTVAAAAALVLLGVSVAPKADVLHAWFFAWVVAGAASVVVAFVQVFAAAWSDGEWIARSSAGRAVGNLRQPNHLASLLMWAAISVVGLLAVSGRAAGARLPRLALGGLFALIVVAIMLTGSRTGAIGVALLMVWGLVDRRLPGRLRWLLVSAPVVYALAWWVLGFWAAASGNAPVGAAQRLGQSDPTTGRWTIWTHAVVMLGEQPVSGVGFGNFNLAWTLSNLDFRWPEFFDHTHNLPLQFLVELGLPLGLTVLGLLAWGLWQSALRVMPHDGAEGAARRACGMMVLVVGLHSLLEYPLWYAYFLFPTAFAWGLCLGAQASLSPSPRYWTQVLGVVLVVVGAAIVVDYRRVSVIFAPSQPQVALESRIADGQRSWLFAHHADYARITTFEDTDPPTLADFRRATHYLLDTRLLTAWARAHAREGQVEKARWIADRLRELKQPSAEPFFAPCTDPAVIDKPFQCTPASQRFVWRDFVVR